VPAGVGANVNEGELLKLQAPWHMPDFVSQFIRQPA
jgi:hypothetical protein